MSYNKFTQGKIRKCYKQDYLLNFSVNTGRFVQRALPFWKNKRDLTFQATVGQLPGLFQLSFYKRASKGRAWQRASGKVHLSFVEDSGCFGRV